MKLVLIDTSGIQRYIFGSNRLRENVGASYLVAMATREWVFDELPQPNNVSRADGSFDDRQCIEVVGGLQAEVVYAGGGNAVIILQREEDAETFVRNYTKRLLIDAPGLQVQVVIRDFDWQANPNGLQREVQAGLQQLNEEKREQSPSQPLLGLGVTRSCQSTGLPAADSVQLAGGNDSRLHDVSQEVHRKHGVRGLANDRLNRIVNTGNRFAYPQELDYLGRSIGEFSYIAVVHIDGNGMGQRIRAIGRGCSNREYISKIRGFSEALNVASIRALNSTIAFLSQSIDNSEGVIVDAGFPNARGRKILLRQENGRWLLPIRPIIYGGDDVSFVCDGRIAIALALEYMRHFESATQELPDNAGGACSCAGIAIVKSHYPFARAYELSEQLCASAKRFVRTSNIDASAIDWHFANAGLAGDLEEIRQREFVVSEGKLSLRPVFVSGPQTEIRSWATMQSGLDAFRGGEWAGRRNKTKALRDVLRSGSQTTTQFCKKFQLTLPDLSLEDTAYRENGWHNGQARCVYFDMIELSDFNIPLTSVQGTEPASQPEGAVV